MTDSKKDGIIANAMENITREKTDSEPEVTDETEILDETDLEFTDTAAVSAQLKKLRQKLTDCEGRKRELGEDLQRTKADYLNARQRLSAEHETSRERQIDDFIIALLPLCDSFAMAMKDQTAWQAVDLSWRTGVEGIKSQLDRLLKEYGVTTFEPVGEPFDPERHDAVETVAVSEGSEPDLVVAVHQIGYQRHVGDTVCIVRPARVSVGAK